mgnify:CR=1 FL=1
MIERYSRKEMVKIWSQEEKFNIWFQLEAHACDAQAKLGVIPKKSAEIIWEKGKFDINKIDEIEKTTKHDVIAFLTNLAEYIGEDARFIHQGMTSSDILDTTLSIQLRNASDILLNDNQWHHIAVVRDGNDLELYRDGILRKKHDISSTTIYNSADPCRIANDGCDSPLDCHISNVRLVKGSAVYTSSFRVPTEPLTNITNTKLLCLSLIHI